VEEVLHAPLVSSKEVLDIKGRPGYRVYTWSDRVLVGIGMLDDDARPGRLGRDI